MHTFIVLEHLQKHGQLFDWEIAEATGIPLEDVRASANQLEAQGDILKCSVTRYIDGNPIEAFQCRIEGYDPRRVQVFGRSSKDRTDNPLGLLLE